MVDRSPLVAVVPPLSPLLFLLFSVVLTVLGRLSLTPFGRPLPMMMCITNTPFQEIELFIMNQENESERHTCRPFFEDSRDYEGNGPDRAPRLTIKLFLGY